MYLCMGAQQRVEATGQLWEQVVSFYHVPLRSIRLGSGCLSLGAISIVVVAFVLAFVVVVVVF